ncbi:MAG: NADH-quinone oxidoreductase subunit NuoF, partial [Candidatus Firestonebacteria bacterium]|nr:NADH-quinone oxidoreductase subunit NuoF [Candidatus Firestonebacteria bacterium]
SSDIPHIFDKHVVGKILYKQKAIAQIKDETKTPYEDIPFYEDLPYFREQNKIVLRHCGFIDPEEIDAYLAVGGYEALKKAIKTMTPEEVIETVKKSGLRGRGGAGFPTGLKWSFCRASKSPIKYLIANGDEGDPGAFMDRSVMEGDPHGMIEGMCIAAYAIGANDGYAYIRAEYPLAVARVEKAINIARERGFLGQNIMGTTFSFDLHVKQGAGAFVCGEETALMASIEGYRGMPRNRPPFPAHKGLWEKPSNINNVETLATVPYIINNGWEWYSNIGTETTKGTKTFALTGKIKHTGLIEVPAGTPLRKIIFDICGGIPDKRKFKAVQIGGPSGGCIPGELIDTPIDYESLIQAGAMMGSGGIVVMDETTCMVDMARFFLNFTRTESCGKCTPCRVGTKTMYEMLVKICKGEGQEGDIERLIDLGNEIKRLALCGLGQTAPNPVLSTIRYFRDEYEAHIRDKTCPAKVCVNLLSFEVIPDLCKKCGLCKRNCPVDAVEWEPKGLALIHKDKCVKCCTCIVKCRFGAIK